jgi:hypothetical protein
MESKDYLHNGPVLKVMKFNVYAKDEALGLFLSGCTE